MDGAKGFQTIRSMINRNAALYPDEIAMKEFETAKACTFKTLKERVNRMGNALHAMGAKTGDRVGILSQNSFEYMESTLSVPSAGLIFVPVNFRFAASEMAGVLSDAEPLVLFVDRQYTKTVEQIRDAIPSVRHFIYIGPKEEKPEGWYDYNALMLDGSPADPISIYWRMTLPSSCTPAEQRDCPRG